VLLELAYREPGQRWRIGESNLTGRGWLCTRQGQVYDYSLVGEASRSGDRVKIEMTYGDPVRSALGNRLNGAWASPVLTLRPERNPFQPDGTFVQNRPVSTSDPDDSFDAAELRKGSQASFLAACGRLAA
jgi:hypothetical protein